MLKSLKKTDRPVRSSDYLMGQVLNKGKTGEVIVAINKKGKTVVLKKIDATVVGEEMVKSEVEAGQQLKHSNIVKINRIFREHAHTFLEMEYLQGHDLYYFMEQKNFNPLEEKEANKLFKQILKALIYIHQKGFVHRDLKLENVFMCKNDKVKLIDFGMAKKVEVGELCDTWCGSIGYVSPEIMLRTPYNGEKADVWSLGTILYALLFAELPFLFNERVEALMNGRGHPQVDFPDVPEVSDDAKDLITKMLTVDPKERISVKEISNHPWVKNGAGKGTFSSLLGRSTKHLLPGTPSRSKR